MFAVAVERNGYVYGYDENNQIILTQLGKLYNFTESLVLIKRNNRIYGYDTLGQLKINVEG